MTAETLQRRDDAQFQRDMDALVRECEDRRLRFMRKNRDRQFLAMSVSILAVLAGSAGFGWFLLMNGNLVYAVACVMGAIILPLLFHFWTGGPIKAYAIDYKKNFMPMLAKILGGFKFHTQGGINAKIAAHSGIVPPFDFSQSEDCFTGVYKGIKVIFSEARLFKKGHAEPVFQGLFILLEAPGEKIQGHTIITSDPSLAQHGPSRWKKLQPVRLSASDESHKKFQVFSDTPQTALTLTSGSLLKELSEASDIFDKAAVTVALFARKYIFMTIPCKSDMFEASDIFLPVQSKQHAIKFKKEIERILEIIDVFDLYAQNTPASVAPAPAA